MIPENKIFPESFLMGSNVIEELVAGKDVRLTATAYAQTAIPEKPWRLYFPEGYERSGCSSNIRNAYQN